VTRVGSIVGSHETRVGIGKVKTRSRGGEAALDKHIDVYQYEAVIAAPAPVACCAPLAGPALSDEEAEATAQIFKALGEPARVRLVNLLARCGGEICMCDLVEPVGLAQPTVSHHMKKLVDAGLVQREQRGKWAFFSLKRDAVEKLAAVADLKGVCP
jgi:ArsR family transcriptional regulator, arsenate/arsenite/antimonite-responsive transcriptional repressor